MPQVPKSVRQVDESYREWVRRQPCVAAQSRGIACWGGVDACHVRSRGAGGSDKANLFPACRKHHTEQHTIGIGSFGRKYGFTLTTIAKDLWRVYTKEGK